VPTYLIIGGSSRAGSTSLFRYLADHPDICRASRKETRFFLSPEFPGVRVHTFAEGTDKYSLFFRHCSAKPVWLEATPDYLYDPEAARRIHDSLPGVKLVFVLRDPVQRLFSWYRFAKQNGWLPKEVSFEAYVQRQLEAGPPLPGTPQYWRALWEGRYSVYLRRYLEIFGEGSIRVVCLGSLKQNPREVVGEIVRWVGLDPSFYNDYEFSLLNPSFSPRFPALQRAYWDLSRCLRVLVHDRPRVRRALRWMGGVFDDLYRKMNWKPYIEGEFPKELRHVLEEYYRNEPNALKQLLNRDEWSW